MLTIGITGGTGLIGKQLSALLVSRGHSVVIFNRGHNRMKHERLRYSHWDPYKNKADKELLKQLDAVVNLAGTDISGKRWTEKRKKEILYSRTESSEFLVSSLKTHAPNCSIFIGASAIGFYGADNGPSPFTEDMPGAHDFLATVCEEWEQHEKKAADFARTVILRIGIVLSKNGGAYKKFMKPLDNHVLPILGSGRQMMSWIHIEDLVKIILFALENEHIEGTYNAVAPSPISNREFLDALTKAKPAFRIPVRVPAFALKLLLGEVAGEALKSTTVSSHKIQQAGYSFQFDKIGKALRNLEAQ